MKSTKTFKEMCNYTHELLTSLGYTYIGYTYKIEIERAIIRYFLGDYEMFSIFNSIDCKHIFKRKKVSFDSPWYEVKTNKAGEYESNVINQLTNNANEFVKIYKQTKVYSRIKEIEQDFQND